LAKKDKKKKTATFVCVMKEWHAPTLLFKVDPPIDGKDHIVVAAASAVDRYEMIIYTAKKMKKEYKTYAYSEVNKSKPFIRGPLPQFKEAIESIGYKIVGDVERFPR